MILFILISPLHTTTCSCLLKWIPTVKDFGLVTGSGATASALPGGGKLTVTAIDDDGVTVEMEFPTKGVCSAGANTLAITDDCSDNKISHEFRQS